MMILLNPNSNTPLYMQIYQEGRIEKRGSKQVRSGKIGEKDGGRRIWV